MSGEPGRDIAGCVGIDLGTTHTALAEVTWDTSGAGTASHVPMVQVTGPGTVGALPLLPSFVYFAHDSEAPLALSWDVSRRFCVGQYARDRATEAPARVVSSAKSWLSHVGIDRRSALPT